MFPTTRVLVLLLALVSSTAHADLRSRARTLPDISQATVDEAVDAAIAEQTPEISAALLVALCWAESRCKPEVHDHTGCGVLQVDPKDMDEAPSRCKVYASSIRAGMAVGVQELQRLLSDGRVHHNLRLGLQYRACGNKAFDGTCSAAKLHWVEAALWMAHRLDEAFTVRPAS